MKLEELVQGVAGATVRGDPETEVRGLAYHTRDVADGTLFFCVPGLSFDGHEFAAEAVEAGAARARRERDAGVGGAAGHRPLRAARDGARGSRWYGDPSRELPSSASPARTARRPRLTGRRVFAAAGRPAGLLGTVVNRIGGRRSPGKLTTAESLDLQRMFAEMLAAGDEACAIEVSSHALAPGPRRRHRLRRGRLHQPDPRSPRLPPRPRGLLRRQAAAVPARRSAQRPAVAVVNVGDEFGAAAGAECAPLYGDDLDLRRRRRRGRRRRRRRRPRPRAACRRLRLHARLPRGSDWTSVVPLASRRASTSRTRWPRRPAGLALGAARSAVLGRPRRHRRRARPLPGGRAGQPFGVRGRLLAHARLAGEGARARPARSRPAACSRVRLRRRPRPRQAPAHGRHRRPACRPCGRHLRQPAHGGPAGDHRRDRARRAARPRRRLRSSPTAARRSRRALGEARARGRPW